MSFGKVVAAGYYGTLTLVLALILTRTLSDVLPGSFAGQVSRNSEGLLILLVVSAWIEFVRRRDESEARRVRLAVLGAVVWLVIGLVLRYAAVPPQLATLNEAALALALLLPYLQLRRPLPLWGWLLPVAAIVVPLIGGSNAVTTDLAEGFGALVLIPLSVDAIDRGILDGTAVPLLRVLVWMGFLVVAVVALHALISRTPTGFVAEFFRYVSRATEMFLASLLLHGYFSLLRPDLRSAQLPGRSEAGVRVSGR